MNRWSRDCQSNSGVRRYSDIGRYRSVHPRMVQGLSKYITLEYNSGIQSGGQIRPGTTGHECQFLSINIYINKIFYNFHPSSFST